MGYLEVAFRANDTMRHYRPKNFLKYSIVVEKLSREEYDLLVEWIRENIPTTGRRTPEYREGRIRFGFVEEEHAMAFKLLLPEGAIT